jgi:hypothetical protein
MPVPRFVRAGSGLSSASGPRLLYSSVEQKSRAALLLVVLSGCRRSTWPDGRIFALSGSDRDDAEADVARLPPNSVMLTDRCALIRRVQRAVAVAQDFGVRHIRHKGGDPGPSENCSVTSKP